MAVDEEYPEFSEVIAALGHGRSDVADETPPASLWESIEAELDEEPEPAEPRPAAGEPGNAILGDDPPRAADELGNAVLGDAGPVVSLADRRSRRRRSAAIVVGIAAALLLIGVPVGLALRSSDSIPDSTADLAALENFDGSGMAELDGRRLTVAAEGLVPPEGAMFELWLLDIDDGELNDLVSLGVIEDDGTYTIDDAVDLADFNVVDISVEPDDGNPEHSGDSVLRGELT